VPIPFAENTITVDSIRTGKDVATPNTVGKATTELCLRTSGIRPPKNKAADGGDKYVLTHSRARFTKEHAMRLAKMRTVMKVLHSIDVRIGKRRELDKDGRPVERKHKALSRDELASRLAVAKSKAGRSWRLFRIRKPKSAETTVPNTLRVLTQRTQSTQRVTKLNSSFQI